MTASAPSAGRGAWFNVNFPYCAPDDVTGVRVVRTQRFARSPMKYYPSDNPGKFFIAIPETPTPFDPANGFLSSCMHGNAITVTPVRAAGHAITRWRRGWMGQIG